MIVNEYRCHNCFCSIFSELLLDEEKAFCPVCGKQGTLEMNGRGWNIEEIKKGGRDENP
jgi:rRNA maturation endonuclease Nob1